MGMNGNPGEPAVDQIGVPGKAKYNGKQNNVVK